MHFIDRRLAQQAAHAEGFQNHPARTRDALERRNGAQSTGSRQHFTQRLASAVEIAKREILVSTERAARETGQPATRLQRDLQQHAEGHRRIPVLRKIPGLDRHVVFNFDARAGLTRAHLGLDAHHAAHEVIGRARQARHPTRSIKTRIHRPKRLGRLAPGAGEQRALVEVEPVHLGHDLGFCALAQKFGVAR